MTLFFSYLFNIIFQDKVKLILILRIYFSEKKSPGLGLQSLSFQASVLPLQHRDSSIRSGQNLFCRIPTCALGNYHYRLCLGSQTICSWRPRLISQLLRLYLSEIRKIV